jgi:hypothetical protein
VWIETVLVIGIGLNASMIQPQTFYTLI